MLAPWRPSSETLLVLKQAGYPQAVLNEAVSLYQEILEKYPQYSSRTNKGFVSFLRTKFVKHAIEVEAKFTKIGFWIPTPQQYKQLEEEGYWVEIIDNQLSQFIFNGNPNREIIISKFAFFQNFLRRRVPLEGIELAAWYPSKALVAAVFIDRLVYEEDFHLFFQHFRASAERRAVTPDLIPRFFYNYIKKNEAKIWSIAGEARHKCIGPHTQCL